MGDTNFETDKNIMYLNLINQRLIKLLEVHNVKGSKNLEEAVVSIKPQYFGKIDLHLFCKHKSGTKLKLRNF